MPDRSSIGVHTALRAPTTTSTPPAALAHSSGSTATVTRACRNWPAISRTRATVGAITRTGPKCAKASISAKPSKRGPRCTTIGDSPLKIGIHSFVASDIAAGQLVRREAGNRAMRRCGDAATNIGRRRPAQCCAAQRAKSMISGVGPQLNRDSNARSLSEGRSLETGNSTIQPETLRPCSDTRTMSPTPRTWFNVSGTT